MSRSSKQENRRRREQKRARRLHHRWVGGHFAASSATIRFDGYSVTRNALRAVDRVEPDEFFAGTAANRDRRVLFGLASSDPLAAIPKIEAVLQQYPNSPTLMNWLAIAYERSNDPLNAERVMRLCLERFPSYLFARTAIAGFALRDGRLDEVTQIFGGTFELNELYPARKVFHIDEYVALRSIAIEYHIRRANFKTAIEMYRELERVAPEHEATRRLGKIAAQLDRLLPLQQSCEDALAPHEGAADADGLLGLRRPHPDDFRASPTEAIFGALQRLGIDTDAERFPAQAAAAQSPSALADAWDAQVTVPPTSKKRDIPLFAVEVLWDRLTPDLCPRN